MIDFKFNLFNTWTDVIWLAYKKSILLTISTVFFSEDSGSVSKSK